MGNPKEAALKDYYAVTARMAWKRQKQPKTAKKRQLRGCEMKGKINENREDILVESFLTCPNISKVSRKTGISRATVYKIMEEESFKEKLMKAKQEALQNAVSFLQGNLSDCADTLMQIIKDKDTSPQTRVNACQIVMSQCKTWTDEIDVISRIAALEKTMSEEMGRQ